jgi:hypothetical protein
MIPTVPVLAFTFPKVDLRAVLKGRQIARLALQSFAFIEFGTGCGSRYGSICTAATRRKPST